MKLKLEDKLKIIELYENGWTVKQISLKYGLFRTTVEHIERQYREHGIESFKEKGKNTKYPVNFKIEIINRILAGESASGIASELCVNVGMIFSWVKKYNELGYNGLIEKKKGRLPKMRPKENKNDIPMDEKDKRIKELEERNAQLEMENDLLKKLRALVQQREQQQNKKK